jgi:hypothetical protein
MASKLESSVLSHCEGNPVGEISGPDSDKYEDDR